jgi:hypothetical protein
MGLFNYIDTFFFISLGITFILILLLVFHFKQQIISLEHKNDTMFEIINNIVKELTALKTAFIQTSLSRENEIINTSIQSVPQKITVENKIVISDSDDDDDDDTSYTSGQSETDSDAESEDDSDSESDDEENVLEKEVVVENIDIHEPREESSNEIKVINIELSNIDDSMGNGSDIEEENDNLEEEDHIEDFVNTETIVVEKIDSSENLGTTEPTETFSTSAENNKEVYRKMSLQALKTLVITKGLSSDTSKMKKNDLLKLLESEI